jgi:hypothetical protein
MASQSATVRLGGSLALRIRHPEPDSAIGNPCPHAAGPHWGRGRAEPGGQQRTAGAVRPGHSQVRGRRSNDHAGSLARDLPETVPHVTSRRHTSQPSTTPLTCSVAWVSEVVHGVVNHPSINGMQGVRGSNPLSSTTTTPQLNRRVASGLSTPPPPLIRAWGTPGHGGQRHRQPLGDYRDHPRLHRLGHVPVAGTDHAALALARRPAWWPISSSIIRAGTPASSNQVAKVCRVWWAPCRSTASSRGCWAAAGASTGPFGRRRRLLRRRTRPGRSRWWPSRRCGPGR